MTMDLTFEQEDFISEKHEEKLLERDDHHDDDYDFASWLAERSKEDRAILLAEMEERVFAPFPKPVILWVDDCP
jgi:hypothetical protein